MAKSRARSWADMLGAEPLTSNLSGNLTVDTNTLHVDASNNRIGLGTSSPRGKLDVANGTISGVANIGGNSDTGAYSIWAGESTLNGAYVQLWGGSSANPSLFIIGTNGSNRVYVDSSGNLGVGTSSPRNVEGYVSLVLNDTTGSLLDMNVNGTRTTSLTVISSETQFGTITDTPLALWTNNAERMRITSAGDVAIGAPNASLFDGVGSTAKLVVKGSDTATSIVNNSKASIVIANDDGTANNLAGLHFARADTDDNPHYAGASIVAQFKETQVTGQYPKADIAFLTSTAANNAPSEKMRINATGDLYLGPGELMKVHPIFSYPSGKTSASFSCTGSIQSWTVPAGVTQFMCKLWGAGGGGGNSGGWNYGSKGGGGGFTIGLVPCSPGTTYYIVVGQPGQTNYTGGTTARYGGGGGFTNNSDNRYAGSGGGYSGLFTSSSPAQANAVLIAGGGGGGGSSRAGRGNQGGAGGGTTGEHGDSPYDNKPTFGGGGGTQSAGGASVGTAGSALAGGRTQTNTYGGGGGGGYYGGGGGAYSESNTMAGGGGGSGYVNTSLVKYGATFKGFRDKPAMSEDPDLPRTYDGHDNWMRYACGGHWMQSGTQYTNMGGGSGFCIIWY